MTRYYPILYSSDTVETTWMVHNCHGDVLGTFTLEYMEDGTSRPILALDDLVSADEEDVIIKQLMERINK